MALKFPFSLKRAVQTQKRVSRLVAKVIGQSWPSPKTARVKKKPVQPRLVERNGFGSNPGRLAMKIHVPPKLPRNAPLVVMLPGCLQTPESFDAGSGFSKMADRRGFALLYPQQSRSNNANLCFNWFRPSAVARDRGELMSIRQMIETAISDHHLDRSRVYIAGLSAGGAMTCALAATHPAVFAGVAIFAGLPFGAARDVASALSVMKSGARKLPKEWGDFVRSISPGVSAWPPIAVWQGIADRTVHPANADAILSQWLNVTGLEFSPSTSRATFWGRVRRWRTGDRDQIIFYQLESFGHGLPVRGRDRAAPNPDRDRFILPAGISAPHELIKVWGL
jgi:poly(hydroxyalkanoate) depolymerase family esterase